MRSSEHKKVANHSILERSPLVLGIIVGYRKYLTTITEIGKIIQLRAQHHAYHEIRKITGFRHSTSEG
ncbi:MAG: hypothetical protein JWM04_19 [Verrucomicrobiales bacterium]|nr:hypothetical protein [Verrucomicrobiales bacterium]